MKSLILLVALITFYIEAASLKAKVIIEDLGGIPWGFEFLDERRAIVTLKEGQVLLVDLKTQKVTALKGGPKSRLIGQGGLLDVALHPEFTIHRRIYFSYTKPVGAGKTTTAIAVGTLNIDKKRIELLKDLFIARPAYRESRHYGSRLVFDRKGFLFFSIGDRGHRDFAQDLSRHNGKVMRLHDDGRTPKDNPFVKQKGVRPEIWTYGHRNPQGLDLHPKTGKVWLHEHGPRGGDEINILEKGANYGWPIVTFGREYWGPKIGQGLTKKKGMKSPIKYYVPSIAPSGMAFYGDGPIVSLRDSVLLGALKLQHLNQVKLKGERPLKETRHFEARGERVRDIRLSPAKKLYYTTDGGSLILVNQ